MMNDLMVSSKAAPSSFFPLRPHHLTLEHTLPTINSTSHLCAPTPCLTSQKRDPILPGALLMSVISKPHQHPGDTQSTTPGARLKRPKLHFPATHLVFILRESRLDIPSIVPHLPIPRATQETDRRAAPPTPGRVVVVVVAPVAAIVPVELLSKVQKRAHHHHQPPAFQKCTFFAHLPNPKPQIPQSENGGVRRWATYRTTAEEKRGWWDDDRT